jgi:hypothetical protein
LPVSPRPPAPPLEAADGDSGWLRIPIERWPNRRRLRKFKAKRRASLEARLLPVDGQVLKLGVRRCQPRQALERERQADAQMLPSASVHALTEAVSP